MRLEERGQREGREERGKKKKSRVPRHYGIDSTQIFKFFKIFKFCNIPVTNYGNIRKRQFNLSEK
jgi:hypothetical protein